MQILNYIRDDLDLNIKSNLSVPIPFNPSKPYLEINYNNSMMEVITPKGRKLSFEEIVLVFMYLINASSREQIGIVIPKNISTILDNELTYLIIKRKNTPEYSDIYFIANENQIIFPFFDKQENKIFNILKFAELVKRRNFDIDEFLDKISSKN